MWSETFRLQHEQSIMKEKKCNNGEKVKQSEHFLSGILECFSVILTQSTDGDCLILQNKKNILNDLMYFV
jgi:hypothetical protein